MRRLAAAVYLVGSSGCLAGVLIAGERGVILVVPMLLFLGMGVYNLARGKDDDRKTS